MTAIFIKRVAVIFVLASKGHTAYEKEYNTCILIILFKAGE
jgi:hypothetical protein